MECGLCDRIAKMLSCYPIYIKYIFWFQVFVNFWGYFLPGYSSFSTFGVSKKFLSFEMFQVRDVYHFREWRSLSGITLAFICAIPKRRYKLLKHFSITSEGKLQKWRKIKFIRIQTGGWFLFRHARKGEL